ncbi:class I SAM-dependent methyltransferase [Maribacter arcticus]|uniref:class I SAM-dependent methyltransferase n=1 Tax=Maribacter arcticus TaxID=561365 RepID=UPI002302BC96|nr:class I SAM-dependent methyltransferase [Maribacter arcticus]MDA9089438.1 class I SAM-dependent methyltransferase [Maribacter arcticus]|tara:strand:- start:403 stop:1041 length:639 start_codon:yes stop_codon:yes gene_type:complete
MSHTKIFDQNVEAYEQWYEDYPQVFESELLALKEQFQKLPENLHGIEVGLGTGRFSVPLGIKEGIEPAKEMAALAVKRGISVVDGYAEHLPFGDLKFDFVLFVTVCHLDNVKYAFAEAYRVLKPKGAILIGFLDKDRSVAKQYIENRHRSTFFTNANFFTVSRTQTLLKDVGFKNLEYNQTLFGDLDEIKEVQMPKEGFGEGSFVVVKATKK